MSDALPTRRPDDSLLGAPCRYCGSDDTWVEWRLVMVDPHEHPYSLAGSSPKGVATQHPFAVCGGCGHVSKGKRS